MQESSDYDIDEFPVLFSSKKPSRNWNDIDYSEYINNEHIFNEIEEENSISSQFNDNEAEVVGEEQISKTNKENLEWEEKEDNADSDESQWSKAGLTMKTWSDFRSKLSTFSERKEYEDLEQSNYAKLEITGANL